MNEKETKTLAFNVSDLERFKDYFPDFRSGKMTGRELGSKLLEVLENQASTNSTHNSQVDENAFNALKVDYQELQEKFRSLENAFQEQTRDKDNLMLETSDNKRLQEQIQELSREKDELLESLNSFKIDNQRLQEIQESASSDFQAKIKVLKDEINAKNLLLKDFKERLKRFENKGNYFIFTPYFNALIENITERINSISGTVYSPSDVIMQVTFATFFNSHSSIKYTYPISREDMLVIARQHYPELATEKDLFDLMIHKIREE